MADNLDNEEDLQELEVRLYSQVHHDSVNIEPCTTVVNEAENSCELGTGDTNNESSSAVGSKKRYWAAGEEPVVSQHRKFVRNDSGTANVVAESITVKNAAENCQHAGPGATPPASGGGPEKRRSINPFSMKGATKNPASKKLVEAGKSEEDSKRFLNRKMRKLEQKKKLNKKREKARLSQQKKGKKTAETIVLESSDEEDVVVVPVPPPPVVTLDSSDEECNAFTKPNSKRASERMPGTSNSRCNSPNSVMSDDFIVQKDKKRLLSETNVAEDEELQCSEDEKRKLNHNENLNTSIESEDFATPAKRASKPMKQNQPSYEVTQSNFRAVDVYESESSDMPESVYGKGKRKNLGAASDARGSDVEEIVAVKTKRLRKRKASGSCKSSEPNDDSSDSETVDNLATALPYISRGEAVEHCKQKTKRRQVSGHEPINQADQEFMDKLSNIVRGNDERSTDLDEGHDSSHSVEEEITARDIAEVVLKQTSKTAEAPEDDAAIPNKAIVDQELLNVIDKICTKIDDFEEPPRHGREPTPELYFDELAQQDSSVEVIVDSVGNANKKMAQVKAATTKKDDNKLDFMHVVYTNRDHVAWNEEMVRFYESSWGQEKFNVDRILRLMDRSKNWRIKNSDRFPKSKRYSNTKCHNCCEFGHRLIECPLPRKDLICFICGDIGHKEPRCPNTMCLRCGGKTNVYTRSCQTCIKENQIICPICRIRGHSIDSCPDKWRRYHSTTTVNEHPNTVVHYNDKKFCCVCAGRGHLPEQCRSWNKLNEYHVPTTEIRYHSKTYEDLDVKDEMGPKVIGVHLMCRPDENITFPFLKKVTKEQYYGRFLDAVDLFDAPESKIVRNLVLNPFATYPGPDENEKGSQANGKKTLARADVDNIQLNVSGILEINDEDDVELVSEESRKAKDKTKCVGKAKDVRKKVSDVIVTLDTDSNYSFSEHFPSREMQEGVPDAAVTIKRRKSVGPLPDFIPIYEDNVPNVTRKKPKSVGTLPDFIALNDSDDDEEPNELGEEQKSQEDCEGKIYLSKLHSKFLLSPSGTTYLIEASKKHNVKVSMDWTAVGNVLVIEGPTANQDKFYAELIEKMKLESDQMNRNTLDQSQKLPRPRQALIKLLQESILGLEKHFGNIQEIYKKLKYNQSNTGKNSFKAAEKNRKILNMILMGQAGLREGSMHLSIIQDKLRELLVNMTCDHVSDEFREGLEKHYRYIFSSLQHNNYDQLIRQYTAMKQLDQLPKLELDYKLLGKKVIDTQFTKELKEQFYKVSIGTPSEGKPQKNESGAESAKVPRTEFGVSFRKQKEHQKQWERDLADKDEYVPPPPPFNPNQNSPGAPSFQKGFNSSHGQSHAGPRGLNTPNQNQQGHRGRGFERREFNSPNQKPFQRPMGDGNSKGSGSGNGNFASNKIREISKKWDERANNSLKELTTQTIDVKQEKRASSFWSRESIKFIARCMSINGLQPSILEKLARLSERAANNQLSFNDFKSIKRIYFNLLKTGRGPGFAGNQSC